MPSIYPQQPIPIEALSEYDVREILLDGHEILEKPLTPAEEFQRIVNQIDFSESDTDEHCIESGHDTHALSKRVMLPKLWDMMRETMRMTLTEINALVDIISVIKEGKYFAINPVVTELPEQNLSLHLSGKKRALSAAADVLIKGTEHLRKRHLEILDSRRMKLSTSNLPSSDVSNSNLFHLALINLRQHWRLKLHQNCILGDVSLRSAGSHFQESGNFEIHEFDLFAEKDKHFKFDKEVDKSGVQVVFSRSMEALLNSAAGFGILDIHFYESDLVSGPTVLWKSVFGKSSSNVGAPKDQHKPELSQQARLFKAQRLLACREILSQLSWEACSSRGQSSVFKDSIAFATQDEIIATLFPGVQISISMRLNPTSSNTCSNMEPNVTTSTEFLPTQTDSMPMTSLGLQLHRILALRHRNAWFSLASLPKPTSCGPVQIPSRLRAAGAYALPASHFTSNDQLLGANYSIAVAGVSGFAAPATSTWFNTTSLGSSSKPADRMHSGYFGQDRLALFTEWGNLQSVGRQLNDDEGFANMSMMEHNLFSRGADDCALKCVTGSSPSMFQQTIAMCRQYYLREKTSILLSDFALTSSATMITHWDTVNSAFQTSARVCFYNSDYDANRYWLGLTVGPNGLTIFYPDPPRTYRLGTDFERLKEILANQVIHTQINCLDDLITKILGWTRLGSNPYSGLVNPHELVDGPMIVKMYTSPSSKHLVSIHASLSFGIRLFVAKSLNGMKDDLDSAGYDSFREVSLKSISGKHVVAKVEAVMAFLN